MIKHPVSPGILPRKVAEPFLESFCLVETFVIINEGDGFAFALHLFPGKVSAFICEKDDSRYALSKQFTFLE